MTFPFWPLHFDDAGALIDGTADGFAEWLHAQRITDLYVFSHGWNNDEATAMTLYSGFFGQMQNVLAEPPTVLRRPDAVIGTVGVVWPSILWPDAASPPDVTGGAAALRPAAPVDLFTELKKVFVLAEQQAILEELRPLLAAKPPSDEALKHFKHGLSALLQPAGAVHRQDSLEKLGTAADDDAYREIFAALADQEPSPSRGGAAAFSPFTNLWNGAKAALRLATYYQMKERAGTVGEKGLGALLGGGGPRIYLLGHSFGARLVSYALRTAAPGAVKLLYLLQGAFSHFAFAPALPFDNTRSGDLVGMEARVDGPLITTHSLFDRAVGSAYPLASIVARQDASLAGDTTYRWGAMGHDGAQAVNAAGLDLTAPPNQFSFSPHRWLNLDGNRVIKNGGLPEGAHGDIVHRETAWVALAAAGLL